MSLLKSLKKLVYHFDLFCSSQLLRYKSQTQYKTLTGGLLSLSIIIVIIVGFASMISETLQRTSITSSLTMKKQPNPPLVNLKPNEQNRFMVGLTIQAWGTPYIADFFKGPQYFSFTMDLLRSDNGVLTSFTPVQLQQCTKQHWKMMPQFSQNIENYSIDKWACLPLNIDVPLQGVYTSSIYEMMIIKVYRCQNSTLNNNSCASEQQIDAHFSKYQNFHLSYQYVNPVINPNLQNYVSYYIQSNDYAIFSKDIGAQSWIYFSDYQIRTDKSILPFQQIDVERGSIVEERVMNHPYGIADNNKSPLVTAFFAKSANSLVYKRQVRKISAVFSYIGGLVGAITAILFLVNMYTDSSLEVSIGLSLFEQTKQERRKIDKEMGGFNFIGFSRLAFYRVLKVFGWKGLWQVPQKLYSYQRQAVKQLDVEILLKRIIKLQACMTHVFTEDQLRQFREEQTITIENARKMRKLLMKKDVLQQQKQSKNQSVFNVESPASVNHPNCMNDPRFSGLSDLKALQPQSQVDDRVEPISIHNKSSLSMVRLFELKNQCKDTHQTSPKNQKDHTLSEK